ncbi:MAG: NAD(P)/FAD-dependent oxidoreductase [Acidobacteria bacterium]|nr:NAD(P)/FAD-dependent oxidoreductase [Acidobacteriota bacterium]
MQEIAIIGAGPYGLSIAAHLRQRGMPFRIFGPPMDTWLSHMPRGMFLKSDGFASNLSDPDGAYTLKKFCEEKGIAYADMGLPVRLETFCAYGLAFQNRMVPNLENRLVVGLDRTQGGFSIQLENGETCVAKRVVLAVGITHFENLPSNLAQLPAQFLSHSARHIEVEPFRGRNIVVMGGGASALDIAGLLYEAGAKVQLIARKQALNFHSKPGPTPRSRWRKLRHPDSGIGPGMRLRFFANAPWAFQYLPQSLRLKAVQRVLGPSGGYFTRDMVLGKVPLLLGYTVERAEVQGDGVHLHLRSLDGSVKEVLTEHVIAATGYRVDLEKLNFVAKELRSQIRAVNGAPVLRSNFESSVPGLYFAGIAAANTFGPVMRFAFGAGFAARRISQSLEKAVT